MLVENYTVENPKLTSAPGQPPTLTLPQLLLHAAQGELIFHIPRV